MRSSCALAASLYIVLVGSGKLLFVFLKLGSARRYALLGYTPTGGFLPTMAAQAAAHLGEFGPQELTNTVWALAALGATRADAAELLEKVPGEVLARLEQPAQARKVCAALQGFLMCTLPCWTAWEGAEAGAPLSSRRRRAKGARRLQGLLRG